MIDLSSEHLAIIRNILQREVPGIEVRVFGSRINGKAETYSDLDLVLVGREKLDWKVIEALKDAFAESDLPFMVDVVDWHAISDEFRGLIERESEVIVVGSNKLSL